MPASRAERVLITGTTSGLGRALLEHYLTAGAQVIAVNRRRDAQMEAAHPSARFECLDVRAADGVEDLLKRLAASGALPDVFILNAGINRVDNDEAFDLPAYREVVDTNLYGVLNFVAPLTRLPPTGTARHLVAVSSMVTYAGNPYGLGYQISKRALTASFEVWSQMYAATDLVFQQVILGPVPSAMYGMQDRLPGWMFRIKRLSSGSGEGAASAIAAFARTRSKKLIYPWRALAVFGGLRAARTLLPGFLQGRRTLAGGRRRSL